MQETKELQVRMSWPKKPKDKKKKFFKSKNMILIRNWKDLDDSSSNKDSEKEANLCLMAGASTSKTKPAWDASSDDEDLAYGHCQL